MSLNIETVPGFIDMPDKIWPEFRRKIYNYLEYTLSSVMTENDLDLLVLLIAEIWGDLYCRTKLLPWEIQIDRCADEHLEALSTIIGYRWNTGLTADQQRESIKLFCLIRRNRATDFGLSNLIRAFGQDSKSFYSTADLRSVEIVEYGSGGADTIEPNMFPGDIKVLIPDMSKILRDSIFDTKLAGTRLMFVYMIFIGIFHLRIYEDWQYIITKWVTFIMQGLNPRIDTYKETGLDTTIELAAHDQLCHVTRGGKPIASCQVLVYEVDPWNDGFILNTPGLTNYRGFIEETPLIVSSHILYS